MTNSRMLLEESISLFDGKVNPICYFSARELEIATNNFSQDNVLLNKHFALYRGFLIDKETIVKKSPHKYFLDEVIHDIVVASRLSVHKNVLKLIGCCLETKFPMAVYESFYCNGTLEDELLRFDLRPSLAWKGRLKVAVDLSNLVAYLHTALPRPLIHRNLKLSNILLGKENGAAKMFGFELCISLPEGKSVVEDDVKGALAYLDPEYQHSQKLNEKADVYAFGLILLALLSGKSPSSYQKTSTQEGAPGSLLELAKECAQKYDIFEFMDPKLSADGQFEALFMLALECTRDRGEDRPDMTQVGTKLAEMYRSSISGS